MATGKEKFPAILPEWISGGDVKFVQCRKFAERKNKGVNKKLRRRFRIAYNHPQVIISYSVFNTSEVSNP
jgi:hypothetical protein